MSLLLKSFDAVKRLWPVLKWGMFLLVLAFVTWDGWKLWSEFDPVATPLRWGWLVLAAVISQLAWLPSMWYWRELMSLLGSPAPWSMVNRAYFCGTLGKYLPGKGAAIVIRSAMLQDCGVPGATAGLSVVVETLTYVWVGTLLALLLFPTLAPHLPQWIVDWAGEPGLRWGMTAAVACGGLVAFVAMMQSHGLLTNVFRKAAVVARPAARPTLGITLAGVIGFLASWWMQGLTLGLTIRAVSAKPWNWNDWPFWTGTVAVALVGGFLAVFAPGGLGVREGLLMEMLERQLAPREAVLVALLLRGVSLAGEILAACALYWGVSEQRVVDKRMEDRG
jgi:uncharacterized membrane protein YbhN (UPF0104 family)